MEINGPSYIILPTEPLTCLAVSYQPPRFRPNDVKEAGLMISGIPRPNESMPHP